ncbi:MAG: flagellar protein FliS [Clostridiales bacterium]|nr:flagellar protein FliS [Clostridiales bacterium]
MTDEQKKQYTLKISAANRTGLIVIIYDMLFDYAEDAIRAAKKTDEKEMDRDAFRFALRHARSCIRELSESLNFQYAPSMQLFSLYRYVDRELAKAQRQENIEPVQTVLPVIRELREAFYEVSKQDTSPVLMENAQMVYAGLTYGKTDLNVNLTDQGSDRGFRV